MHTTAPQPHARHTQTRTDPDTQPITIPRTRRDLRRQPRHKARHHGRARVSIRPRPVPAAALFTATTAAGAAIVTTIGAGFAIYGVVLAVILGTKLALSLAPPRRHPTHPPTGFRVGVIVPVYNEDPHAFHACLTSILRQTWLPAVVIVVDDGSADPAAADIAAGTRGVRVIRLPANVGKRAAFLAGLRSTLVEVDAWCTVDSDTVLDADAIWHGIRPFNDQRVTATTGTVLALNRDGLLPRLIGLRYTNAFLGERAAYSRIGAVLCCCGSLAFYRSGLVEAVAVEWSGQTFLGRPVVAGDDRRLTAYALAAGRVELARDAVAYTMVPERVTHMVRQQVRWGRSFWRESVLMLAGATPRRAAWWLTLLEVASTTAFTVALVYAAVHAVASPSSALPYLGWIAVTSWARSVHVMSVRGLDRAHEQLVTFALAPVYGVMSLVVLLPLRVWSLVTVATSSWGTRSAGAEVSFEAAA